VINTELASLALLSLHSFQIASSLRDQEYLDDGDDLGMDPSTLRLPHMRQAWQKICDFGRASGKLIATRCRYSRWVRNTGVTCKFMRMAVMVHGFLTLNSKLRSSIDQYEWRIWPLRLFTCVLCAVSVLSSGDRQEINRRRAHLPSSL